MIGRINGDAAALPSRVYSNRQFPVRSAARYSRAVATSFQAEAQQTGALKLTTADGDTVTISFSALEELQSDSYSAQKKGGTLNYSRSAASSSTSVNIQVDGSLDKGEIEDIGKVLNSLAKAVNSAQNGDTSGAAAALADTGSLDSVKDFQFAYQESARIAYSQSQQQRSQG